MVHLAALLVPFLLIVFWLWMFSDMLRNDDIPDSGPAVLHWPPETKSQWMIFFVIFNLFTAGYYYFTAYKNRRQP